MSWKKQTILFFQLNVDCDVTDKSNSLVSLTCVLNKGWEGLSGLEVYANCKESAVKVVVTPESETGTENESKNSSNLLYKVTLLNLALFMSLIFFF